MSQEQDLNGISIITTHEALIVVTCNFIDTEVNML